MELRLHANATTTPRTRAYIQSSPLPVAALASELGVSETTVRRWRGRHATGDRSHTPHKLAIGLTPVEEELIRELRIELALSLDDIAEVMRRCVLREPGALPRRRLPLLAPCRPQPQAKA
jgi:hypothetical protein